MKKTIILVALMLLGDMRLSAQAPILPLDTNLYYDWWWYDDLMSDTAQYIYFNIADASYTGDSNYDAPTRLCLFWAYGYVLCDMVIT